MDLVCCHLVKGLPSIGEGDDLAAMIRDRFSIRDGDVVCIASTVVSKSEGRARKLEDYAPSARAEEIAKRLDKDPSFVQAVLEESEDVLLDRPFLLVATKFGHIGVNAGIDRSNVSDGRILLLPENPNASADRIRMGLQKDCAVIVTDTCGRAFRCGVAGVAIGWEVQSTLAGALVTLLGTTLPPPSALPVMHGLIVALALLLGFVLPHLIALGQIGRA